MEKRVVVAMVLSLAILLGWSLLQAEYAPPPLPPSPAVSTGTVGPPAPGPDGTGGPAGNGGAGNAAPPPAEVEDLDLPHEAVDVESGRLGLTLDSRGGSLSAATVWSCEYHERGAAESVTGDPVPLTTSVAGTPGFLAARVLRRRPDLALRNWTVERTDDGARAIVRYPTLAIELEKRFVPSRDPAAPYHADLRLIVRGLEGARRGEAHTLELVGPLLPRTAHPLPEDAVLVAAGEEVTPHTPANILEELEEDPDHELAIPDLAWIGVRQDFHLSAVEPAPGAEFPAGTSVGFVAREIKLPGEETPFTTAAATLRLPLALPGPGEEVVHDFRIYVGPNSRPVLTQEPYRALEPAFPRRGIWFISFGWISDLLGLILRFFAEALGMGYGVAVAALTIVVRGCMFPLSRKSQISMRIHGKKMARIKPKLDAIKAKYKDPRKQQQAQMKLMREEKMSLIPGGCLLAFIQMPIWFALYGLLQTTFEMRHASFLWADSLTAPDHLLHMPWMPDLPLLPQWLNLFPILMMITWGISARMTPLPADEAQAKQAKMMRWMPMLFGLMLYKFASGLTIYMTCSALWSIGEIQLIRRLWLNKIDAA